MGQRMQRSGERFDDFCRVIEALSFRLRQPLPDASLVQLLKANADPQLRRVLSMHVAQTVDDLQDICLKYEDMWISHGHWRGRSVRGVEELDTNVSLQQGIQAGRDDNMYETVSGDRQVAAFALEGPPQQYMQIAEHVLMAPERYTPVAERHAPGSEPYVADPFIVGAQATNTYAAQYQTPAVEPRAYVSAIQGTRVPDFVCWNCEERGHTYQDCCVATRNVFWLWGQKHLSATVSALLCG